MKYKDGENIMNIVIKKKKKSGTKKKKKKKYRRWLGSNPRTSCL